MCTVKKRHAIVRLTVKVYVDLTDAQLLDRYDGSTGPFSIAEVVRSEIESNLGSVSYVRHASVKSIERR